MLKCIIVDDEAKSRESLNILLTDFCENAAVLALCQNVDEGIQAISVYQPDLVFLDIQMQRETGFDLLTRVPKIDFEVIFTTAHSEFAIKAFQFSAVDYLLKPIDIGELQRAINKVEKKANLSISLRLEQLVQNLRSPQNQITKIALPSTDGLIFVKIAEIIYCEASSNYTKLFLNNGREYIVSRTLREYDELLSDYNFYRVHNSFLINLNEIKKYVRGDGGYVIMSNEATVDVSKRKKEGFLKKLGFWIKLIL